MSNSSNEVRATSEMKIHDDVTIADLKEIVGAVSRSTETEGNHIPGHNYYIDEAQRILFVHEHYRDVDAMLQHLKEMDVEKVTALMSSVDVLDLRVYGPINQELEELLAGFGAFRKFDYVSGFTHKGA